MTFTLDLTSYFDRHFEALPATEEVNRREVFRLRFAVYCEEHGYETPSAFPNGEEHDGYDNDSASVLIRHRASGRAAGCVRLITNERTADLRFPFEQLCGAHLDPHFLDLMYLARDRIGEISRLAVHQDFRRRRIDVSDDSPLGVGRGMAAKIYHGGARRYPLVAMGLFLSASALALNAGLDRAMVVMEPRLARLLGGSGIPFKQVGNVINYRGQRAPFCITREELLGNLHPECKHLLDQFVHTLQ
jgi:N-acyl amino acid synthase of PEP-CTERM/exosortase system